MKPIDVDKNFMINLFNNETYLTLKVNDQTEEPVDADYITE